MIKTKMDNIVSIERCPSYQLDEVSAAIQNSLTPFGGMESFVKKGNRVLLKPNLLYGKPPERAVTTHPAVLEALASMVLDCGAKVVIGDSPPLASANKVAHACGVEEFAVKMGIPIVDFRSPTSETRRKQQLTVGISTPYLEKTLQEFDIIINVPKFKAHCQMVFTGAVKNLYGCVPKRRKAYWHFRLQRSADEFAAMLLAVMEKVSPELTVIDAVTAMEGQGPNHGTPTEVGLVIAGTNPVAMDRVVAEIVDVNVQDHFVLRTAQNLGFYTTDLKHIEIYGSSIEDAKPNSFVIPPMIPIGFSITHLVKGMVKYLAGKIHKKQPSFAGAVREPPLHEKSYRPDPQKKTGNRSLK